MSAKRLGRRERARVAERLAEDGPLVPLAQLRDVSGLSLNALTRWVIEGRSGTYLDAVRDGCGGWLSSAGAFRRAVRERTAVLKERERGGIAQ